MENNSKDSNIVDNTPYCCPQVIGNNRKGHYLLYHIHFFTHLQYREALLHHDWWVQSFHDQASAPRSSFFL